jgi:hypothetical protein
MQIAREEFLKQRLSLTRVGAQVLAGTLDAAGLIERDEWLGGVHFQTGQPMWTWDADGKQLELREP